jgi:hypothetical protein
MNDDDVIFSYGADQAIKDGVLYHPYPTQWPWLLITQSIHTVCKGQEGRTYDQALKPLLVDCIMEVTAKKPDHEDFPLVLEHTVAGTVWIMPNEKGGMTVMKPEDY